MIAARTRTTASPQMDPFHPFRTSSDAEGTREVSIRTGASSPVFGTRYLMLGLATRALHGCLQHLGVANATGPAPVVVKLRERDFITMRDALAADSEAGEGLFKRPRRKRVDQALRRFMLGGILFVADDEPDHHSFACPMSSPKRKEAGDAL